MMIIKSPNTSFLLVLFIFFVLIFANWLAEDFASFIYCSTNKKAFFSIIHDRY